MSLRSDATQPPATATATRSRVLNTSDPFRTAGPLYSDAIRLRPGATLGGTTPSSQFVPASRSQKSIVSNRAASTRAPNGGLDIDALVAQTGLRLRSGHDSELDTESVMQKVADVKKWWQKKKAQLKEGEDTGANPQNGTSAALAEAQFMVEQHAVEVHGLDLETANADTRAMHADMAETIVQMNIASPGSWEHDTDVGSFAWWDRHSRVGVAASLAVQKAVVSLASPEVSTSLWLRSGDHAEVGTEFFVKKLGKLKERYKKWSEARAAKKKEKKARVADFDSDSDSGSDNDSKPDLVGGSMDSVRTMLYTQAAEEGIDLRHANSATRALFEDVIVAIQHIDAMAGVNWEQQPDIGAWEWWENGKQRGRDALQKARDAAGRASDAAGRASAKAKEVADTVKGSSVGKMASKAKKAAESFAKAKYDRFTNEERITKMERYDYGLYASQNPLTNVLIDGKGTPLDFGGDPKSKGYDPRTHAAEGNMPFYGLIATKQKTVFKNERGDMAFNELTTETLKVLSIEKNRDLFAVTTPDGDILAQMDKNVLGLSSHSALIERALAQGKAQTHALPDPNNTTMMHYPPNKPNGAHPLCMGHSMMVPISELGPVAVERQPAQYAPDVGEEGEAGEVGGDPLSLVRASVSLEWLKQVEKDLVASPLRKEFGEMASSKEANYLPFIIPLASKYDTNSDAFTKSQIDPLHHMRAVSALLVVPITEALLTKTGAFKMSNGNVDMGWKRLYPFQEAPKKTEARKDFKDPYGERRKGINAHLQKVRDARDGTRLPEGRGGLEEDLETAAEEDEALGYDSKQPAEMVTWSLEQGDFLDFYSVAVFALGVAPVCDVGGDGNKAACQETMDAAGSGKVLMIGKHPLLMGKRHNGANYDGFEHPATVYTSMGDGMPLVNALSVALDGTHIDLRFLWSSMKLLQSCWSKATSARVSKPSLARFRYLIGLDQELWSNADRAFNFSGYARSQSSMFGKQKSGSFQRRDPTKAAFDDYRLGKALEELGLVHAETGKQLELDEMTPSDLAMALQLAEIHLGDESDEDP